MSPSVDSGARRFRRWAPFLYLTMGALAFPACTLAFASRFGVLEQHKSGVTSAMHAPSRWMQRPASDEKTSETAGDDLAQSPVRHGETSEVRINSALGPPDSFASRTVEPETKPEPGDVLAPEVERPARVLTAEEEWALRNEDLPKARSPSTPRPEPAINAFGSPLTESLSEEAEMDRVAHARLVERLRRTPASATESEEQPAPPRFRPPEADDESQADHDEGLEQPAADEQEPEN